MVAWEESSCFIEPEEAHIGIWLINEQSNKNQTKGYCEETARTVARTRWNTKAFLYSRTAFSLSWTWSSSECLIWSFSLLISSRSSSMVFSFSAIDSACCIIIWPIETVDKVTENVVRRYIADLQQMGKYSFYSNDKTKLINYPERRRDFRQPVSTTTVNNYIRNLRAFFNWLDSEYLLIKNLYCRILSFLSYIK